MIDTLPVEPDMSEEDVQKIVDSGQANDVIKKALISENLQNVVADIEERHAEILHLERQVLEVFELFKGDLNAEIQLSGVRRFGHARGSSAGELGCD